MAVYRVFLSIAPGARELSVNVVHFHCQVLDKGPSSTQAAVLQILHCIVHCIDIKTASTQAINSDLLRVVAKYVEVSETNSLAFRHSVKSLAFL